MSRPRRRGPKPHPLGRLTPEFENWVATSGHASKAMAGVACLTPQRFSTLRYNSFALTPYIVRQLRTLASALYFRGDVFEVSR